jgi:hypothetical protein
MLTACKDAEMKMDRLLEYKILKAWNDLKKERKVNGFSSTKLHVHVKVKEMAIEEDRKNLEQEIVDELKELEEIHHFEELHHQRVFESRLEEWNRKHEVCEKLNAERRREYEEQSTKGRFGITGLPDEFGIDKQLLGSMKSLNGLESLSNLVSSKKIKNGATELPWVDEVIEEPKPEISQSRPFKEEHAKKIIKKVKPYNLSYTPQTNICRESKALIDRPELPC